MTARGATRARAMDHSTVTEPTDQPDARLALELARQRHRPAAGRSRRRRRAMGITADDSVGRPPVFQKTLWELWPRSTADRQAQGDDRADGATAADQQSVDAGRARMCRVESSSAAAAARSPCISTRLVPTSELDSIHELDDERERRWSRADVRRHHAQVDDCAGEVLTLSREIVVVSVGDGVTRDERRGDDPPRAPRPAVLGALHLVGDGHDAGVEGQAGRVRRGRALPHERRDDRFASSQSAHRFDTSNVLLVSSSIVVVNAPAVSQNFLSATFSDARNSWACAAVDATSTSSTAPHSFRIGTCHLRCAMAMPGGAVSGTCESGAKTNAGPSVRRIRLGGEGQ